MRHRSQSTPARLWARFWRRAGWRRVVRELFAPPKDGSGSGSSAAQARFWRELREGQRVAEARAAAGGRP